MAAYESCENFKERFTEGFGCQVSLGHFEMVGEDDWFGRRGSPLLGCNSKVRQQVLGDGDVRCRLLRKRDEKRQELELEGHVSWGRQSMNCQCDLRQGK